MMMLLLLREERCAFVRGKRVCVTGWVAWMSPEACVRGIHGRMVVVVDRSR